MLNNWKGCKSFRLNYFLLALRSCYLGSSLGISLGSKFYSNTLYQNLDKPWILSVLKQLFNPSLMLTFVFSPDLAITDDVPGSFTLKPTESSAWSVSPSRLVTMIVNLSVPSDQTQILAFFLLICSSPASHSLESSFPINVLACLHSFAFLLFSPSHSRV